MGTLDKADVGIFTFFASEHPTDLCGTNGLPLTPNSIVIMGEFQALKKLHHRNVCQYLEVFRAKHERIIIAEEHYQESIARCIRENKKLSLKEIRQIAFDVLHGLAFLNSHGVVHRNLSPENVLIDPKGNGKLSKSGIYYMTRFGTLVTFPVGSPKYMAPEVLAAGPGLSPIYGPSGFKVDVWSLGMIITELILGGVLWPDIPERSETKKIFERIFNLVKKSKETHEHPLNLLMGDHNAIAKLQEVPLELIALLKKCLTVSPTERPEPAALLNHEFFDTIRKDAIHLKNGFHPFPAMYRSRDLDLEQLKTQVMEDNDEVEDLLAERPLREVYYLWTLAGGDLQGELKKRGLLKAKAPVLTLPHVQLHGGDGLGMEKDKIMLFDDTTITASLSQLRERLKHVDESVYFPLIEDDSSTPNPIMLDTAELPIVIREKTVDYQFHRVVLFQRLLEGYPYTKDRIVREARTDIPPLVRGKVWAALLNVKGDVQSTYDNIDKESTTPTDRQIEVDIPRCHQYDEILSSPTGHSKFKRVLKAWVVSHPNLVYWQGLDSLCAPFLSLHFIDEALAYACLASFVPKYLHNFFLKDNSPVIQEYLAVFSHLVAFHDPELFNHLHEIGFIPELYAIPWFLTMYTHVFPLHKIYHLWDTLLLGNSSFPLCIGVAILQQLRDQLLSFGFNECILLFSDMPGIDIERVVRDSKKIFCSTPRTVTVRRHDKPREKSDSKPEKEFLPIGQLKEEICPRITAQDLVHVCELNKSGPLPKRKVKPRGLVLDIRPTQEFNCGQVTDSVNLPYNQAFLEDGGLVSSPATTTLLSFKGRVIVVLGSRSSNPSGFSAKLVKQAFPKVCVLEEQGITKLRNIGILTVPT